MAVSYSAKGFDVDRPTGTLDWRGFGGSDLRPRKKRMNKPELCARAAAATSMSRTDAGTAAAAVSATITDDLAAGEIAASCVPAFKPGKTFRAAVNRYRV